MLGFTRWHLFKGSAAILCIVGIASLLLIYFFPAPPSTIAIAVGFKGGSYGLIAEQYKNILARSHVKLEPRITSGGVENVTLLQNKNSGVSAASVQGGILDSEQAPGLLSLGRINYQIFCIFYCATEVMNDLTELKGKRIAVGPVGAAGRVVSEKVLAISGISSENSTLSPLTGQAAANALNDDKIDATILGLSSDAPILQTLLRDSRIRIMSVTDAEALTRIFPFLVRLTLPRGAIDYEKKIPASDIVLFATTNAILIRSDLHPSYISLLAQALKETHRKRELFQQADEFPTLTDPEFPMAEGAVDFYKNGLPCNCFSIIQFCAKAIQIARTISTGLHVPPTSGHRSKSATMRFPRRGVGARNRAGGCRQANPFAGSPNATLGLVFLDKVPPRRRARASQIVSRQAAQPKDQSRIGAPLSGSAGTAQLQGLGHCDSIRPNSRSREARS